jgi:protein dithiol oxidoreductase (disulfide-forming)
MKVVRIPWLAVLLLVAGLLSGCAGFGLVEDRDYLRIDPPQAVASGKKVEVIEFFWYGCPHCADMHPRLSAWLQRQPADVSLRYQPVAARERWEGGARVHYALEALGRRAELAGAVFEATQLDGIDLNDEAALFDWAERQGLDRQQFIDAWRSPAVQRQVEEARDVGQRYQIGGVPALVVDGKYLTSNAYTGSAQDTLAVLDRLVQRAREERAR